MYFVNEANFSVRVTMTNLGSFGTETEQSFDIDNFNLTRFAKSRMPTNFTKRQLSRLTYMSLQKILSWTRLN